MDGAGHVVPGDGSNIHRYIKQLKFMRDFKTLQTLKNIRRKSSTLPFAE